VATKIPSIPGPAGPHLPQNDIDKTFWYPQIKSGTQFSYLSHVIIGPSVVRFYVNLIGSCRHHHVAFSPLSQLLDDIPPDIDITQSKYLFGHSEWEEVPVLTVVNLPQRDHLDRRMTQDALYRHVGNPTTWNRYVTLGYYIFDDCFQFDTQWTKLCTNLTKKYKFLWFSYAYHITRYLEVPTQLSAWAIDIARPYLQLHLPDAYNPVTTDPREGRYDDSDDNMDAEEADRKPAAKVNEVDDEAGWTLMGPYGKRVRNTSPPASTSFQSNAPPSNSRSHFLASRSY
jgi:hypothetical protein